MAEGRESSERAGFERFAFPLPGKMRVDAQKLKEEARGICTVGGKCVFERMAPQSGDLVDTLSEKSVTGAVPEGALLQASDQAPNA